GQWVLTPTLPAGAYGVYTLTIEAWDHADNRSAALSHVFTYALDTARAQVQLRRVDASGATLGESAAITPGSRLTYVVTLRNIGGLTATAPLTLTIAWPPLLDAPNCQATDGASCAFDGLDARVSYPGLARGAQQTITLSALSPASLDDGVAIRASAQLTGASITRAAFSTLSAQATHTTAVQSALAIHKSASAASVFAHDPLTFTVRVTNMGSALLRNLTITDVLPANYAVQTYTLSGQGNVSAACALGSELVCAARRPLRVLFVDDNESSSSYWRRLRLSEIASARGWQLEVFDAYGSANGPAGVAMLHHDLVIWDSQTKADWRHIGPSEYDARQLMAYVAGGGRLILATSWMGAFADPVYPSTLRSGAAELLSTTLRVDPNGFQVKVAFDMAFNRGFTGTNAFAGIFVVSDGTSYQPSYVPALSGGTVGLRYLDTGDNPAAVYAPRTMMIGFGAVATLAVNRADTLAALITQALDALAPPAYSLGNNQSLTLTVSGVPTAVGARTNTAQARAANAALVSADVSYTALVSTALQGSAVPAVPLALVGAQLSLTARITNSGPVAATSVVLTAAIPSGTALSGYAGDGLSCADSGGVLSCTAATLNVGSSAGAMVTLTLSGGGQKTMTFWRSSDQSARRGDVATFVAAGDADLRLAQFSASSSHITAGLGLTLTLVVVNDGPQPGEVMLTTTLSGWQVDGWPGMGVQGAALAPGAAQIAGVTGAVLQTSGGGWRDAQMLITLTAPSLAVGGALTMQLPVSAHPALISCTLLTAQAGVTSPVNDPALGNNLSAPLILTTTSQASLRLVKQALGGELVNQPITYALTLFNDGPSAAHALVITDPLPGSHAFRSAEALINGFTRPCWLSSA
ncbi:MAG: hypothetical protein SNJ83_14905, partial [Aggregatilineales bacterium]